MGSLRQTKQKEEGSIVCCIASIVTGRLTNREYTMKEKPSNALPETEWEDKTPGSDLQIPHFAGSI